MYICPTCNREFETEERISKHFLSCWKSEHPFHVSKPAPQKDNISTREINDDILSFFNQLSIGE